MSEMLADAAMNAETLGIDLIDVRVKKIELSDEVSESVYNRMRQERARIASELRAEGSESATKIRAGADRERTVILANAYRESQTIRGDGDASSANIYAQRITKIKSFTHFIEAYRPIRIL